MVDPRRVVPGSPSLRCVRCSECRCSFRPHPRLKLRQKTCGKKSCQLRLRARQRRKYRRENPEAEKDCRDKCRESRGSGYWKRYRLNHPQATERNRLASRLRARLRRAGLQRQLDIAQVTDPPGYFALYLGFATSNRSLIEASRAKRAA